jgi:acyl-coenzyme A synthetase/AMP-(fatty) acid ligase/acyl carrier protein
MTGPDPLGVDANWLRSSLPMPDPGHLSMTLGESLRDLAARHPDRLAIVSATERVTFAELAEQAGALAEAIRSSGTPTGPVALLLPSGVAYIAAWFACATAGRAMLMVELANPPARNALLLDAAGATLVLHDGDAAAVQAMGARPGLLIEGPLPPRPLPPGGVAVEEPAFLFATSGSSGTPKLVVYSQATVQGKVRCSAMVMGVEPGDTVMIAGSHANFGVLHHALAFLFRGGTLCLHDMREGGLSGMFAAIGRFGAKHLRFTPSLFRTVAAMPEAAAVLRGARAIRFAGEPLLRDDIERARAHIAPDCAIQNLYGSTESMIFFWSDRTEEPPPGAVVPNGRIYPIAEFMLLDDAGQPVPAGDAGELVISSRFHALGDWIEGRVDPGRFPPDPRGEGRRLYRTGDIARLLPDGTMIVQGRKDRLLKINGQRVSLLEIEATLRTMPGCAQVAVLPRQRGGTTQLLAFLVLADAGGCPVDPAAWLAARLPRYMVPARFLRVAELPLLPVGKVDGEALLASLPDEPDDDASAPAPEDTALLRVLRGIWGKVLGVPPPGLDDDFFALGGDSLKLLDLTLAVERHTGRDLSPAAFLQWPTIRRLATLLEMQAATPGAAPAPPTLPGTPYVARGRVVLRRIRHARGVSRGIVLGMPHFRGDAGPAAMIAAQALQDHEVWAFAADLGGRTMWQDDAWIACAIEIAEQLAATPWLRPQALYGYSVGGYLAWLVDRILAGGPWRPGRVIAFDSGPAHDRRRNLRDRVDALIAGGTGATAMLLLHRSMPAPFSIMGETPPRWSAIGVSCHSIPFRTVSHSDLRRAEVSVAARDAMAAFVNGGDGPFKLDAADPEFPTVGGALYRLLAAGTPPDAASLRGLVADPAAAREGHCRPALVFLVLAAGDQDLAMDVVSRLAAAYPRERMVRYALIGLLALRGDQAAAMSAAEEWCSHSPRDRAMRIRAEPFQPGPATWRDLADVSIGTDLAIDRALDLLGTAPADLASSTKPGTEPPHRA